MKKVIDIIVGTRPNFMKASALFVIANKFPKLKLRLIHTGQHYNDLLSKIFLRELDLPKPVCNLGVGSGSQAIQTGKIMKNYEAWMLKNQPDMCIVVGDVNSTLACSLVSAKMNIPLAHIEAGLRSFDLTMPEEINRKITDCISTLLFVTEPSAINNLRNEGHPYNNIHYVGNVMIDTLLHMKKKITSINLSKKFAVTSKKYVFMTLHRPSNVDNKENLKQIIKQIIELAKFIPIILALHPRTQKNLNAFNLMNALTNANNCKVIEPVSYLESIALISKSKFTITDSGGIQEETTVLNVPCLTLRNNTERPITISHGTNTLINNDWSLFKKTIKQILENRYFKTATNIPYWDGKTGWRILNICEQYLSQPKT